MEGLASTRPQYNRWLPYWAVFQADMHQTLRSWVYRIWVVVSVLAGGGFLLYQGCLVYGAGVTTPAYRFIPELLAWTALGSVTLIIALTTGCISGERGTMADSVLSRGISRYQYFLGKWHSRLLVVLATVAVLGVALLIGGWFVLPADLSLSGCLMALVTVVAMLAAVVTAGVTLSAMCNNTALGIAALWLALYGGGFLMMLMPASWPAPGRVLAALPNIMKGYYDTETLVRMILLSLGCSIVLACVGMTYFGRRDI